MPIYTFRNNVDQTTWTETMTIAERTQFLADNRHIEQLIVSPPALADPKRVGIRAKPDDGFRDVLRDIKSKNYGSNIDTF